MNVIDRAKLVKTASNVLQHAKDGSHALAPDVLEMEASTYTDPERFELEKKAIFRRLPLMLATSSELPKPGDFKAMDVAGVPVLLVRGKSGQMRALLNMCTHRAAPLAQGQGNTSRFSCPYHGWTFTTEGRLMGIAWREDFGSLPPEAADMATFPVLEKAGLIWVVLDPSSTLDIEQYLSGYDNLLQGFGLDRWNFIGSRTLKGANWKLAFDAHLEFYHLPVLHRNTFGPTISNRALYYFQGPHQRLIRTAVPANRTMPKEENLFSYMDSAPETWPINAMMLGEWILFPHVSINSFYDGGRGVIISQVFPGERVDESFTVQTYLMEDEPNDVSREAALKTFEFLGHVVGQEDLPMSMRQQQALNAGIMKRVFCGRNEGGLQHFHRWIERIVNTSDTDLNSLFDQAGPNT